MKERVERNEILIILIEDGLMDGLEGGCVVMYSDVKGSFLPKSG